MALLFPAEAKSGATLVTNDDRKSQAHFIYAIASHLDLHGKKRDKSQMPPWLDIAQEVVLDAQTGLDDVEAHVVKEEAQERKDRANDDDGWAEVKLKAKAAADPEKPWRAALAMLSALPHATITKAAARERLRAALEALYEN